MNITGAQAVVKSLLAEGVELIFGYPGGAIMPVYDALYDHKEQLRHILVRHEQGAVHAAEGYARASDRVGVCIATSGPGATNFITGITDALLDSVPLVCITGQINSKLLGSDAFQEADIVGMTLPVTKWNTLVTAADQIPVALAKAFAIARSGRPGPVLVDISKDAQLSTLSNFSYSPQTIGNELTVVEQDVASASELINQAQRPLLLVGHGVILADAQQELITMAERAQIPMAATLLGLSAVDVDHPLYVGLLGMHGNYGANILTNEADLLIAVGMRFDDRVTSDLNTYAKQAKVIHIEIDEAEINKNVPADVALHLDAKDALAALLHHVQPNDHQAWLARFKQYIEKEYNVVKKQQIHPESGPIRMAEVVHMLSRQTKGEAIIVSDVGQHQMVAARYYQYKKFNHHITSGGLGTMGYGLPAAIGAKFAKPEELVVAIVGDGGLQMNIQELAVLAQENIAVKIIVLNNFYLGMVRQWQQMFFEKRYSFTNLVNPDFTMVANAYGIKAKMVSERSMLSAAIAELIAYPDSYLLEIQVERQDNVFPMIPANGSVGDVNLGEEE